MQHYRNLFSVSQTPLAHETKQFYDRAFNDLNTEEGIFSQMCTGGDQVPEPSMLKR